MSLELINFVYDSIASGAVGNGAYDIIKSLFNKSFERLLKYVGDNDKDNFKNTLEILLESNEELKNKLMALKTTNGDNVGGDKITVNGTKNTGKIGSVVTLTIS